MVLSCGSDDLTAAVPPVRLTVSPPDDAEWNDHKLPTKLDGSTGSENRISNELSLKSRETKLSNTGTVLSGTT